MIMEELKITVQNVKCGGCVANITSNLTALGEISDVAVDLASGEVTIHGQQLDSEKIKDKLIALGYPPANG